VTGILSLPHVYLGSLSYLIEHILEYGSDNRFNLRLP
jgi:hypothetical protein